jgi:predicted PurR-regulated permease PerM
LKIKLLIPRIIGESVGIHPAIPAVVSIAMGQIFRLLGVFLTAPLSAIGRDLFLYTYRRLDGNPTMAAPTAVSGHSQPAGRTQLSRAFHARLWRIC